MEGIAEFTPIDINVLSYHEDGHIQSGGLEGIRFYRDYTYVFNSTSFHVFFDKERLRLFHAVQMTRSGELSEGVAFHRCPPDDYRSSYTFGPGSRLQIEHEVKGPKKDYSIETIMMREQDP